MFEMKDEYRLGVELIDKEHEKLFEIGERAFQLLKDEFVTDKYDRIVEIIKELEEYSIMHFSHEEEYMQSIGYRKLLSHKVEHVDFIKTVNEIDLSNMDENQDAHIMGILDFVAKWLTDHIMKQDQQIVQA